MYITYHIDDGYLLFGDTFTSEDAAHASCEYLNNRTAILRGGRRERYAAYEPGQSLHTIAVAVTGDAQVQVVPF